MDQRLRLLLEAPPGRTILRLAWPNVLVMADQCLLPVLCQCERRSRLRCYRSGDARLPPR